MDERTLAFAKWYDSEYKKYNNPNYKEAEYTFLNDDYREVSVKGYKINRSSMYCDAYGFNIDLMRINDDSLITTIVSSEINYCNYFNYPEIKFNMKKVREDVILSKNKALLHYVRSRLEDFKILEQEYNDNFVEWYSTHYEDVKYSGYAFIKAAFIAGFNSI